jgi:hypothetical protein
MQLILTLHAKARHLAKSSGVRGQLVDCRPKTPDSPQCIREFGKTKWFYDVCIRTVVIALLHVAGLARRGKNYNRYPLQMFGSLDLVQHFEAGDFRHFHVEQHDRGTTASALREIAASKKVVQRVVAITDELDSVCQTIFPRASSMSSASLWSSSATKMFLASFMTGVVQKVSLLIWSKRRAAPSSQPSGLIRQFR